MKTCFFCNKKVKSILKDFKCKCNHVYCFKHLNKYKHNCVTNKINKINNLKIVKKNIKNI
jgi:hypothetical protein